MYGELSEGKRSTRGQRSVTKDCLKVAEQDLGVDPSTLDKIPAPLHKTVQLGAVMYTVAQTISKNVA
jgi:hypothetical protein